MKINTNKTNRRKFIKGSTILTAGLISTPLISLAHKKPAPNADGLYIIGPKEGYTPEIGTLLSTMRTGLYRSNKDWDMPRKSAHFYLP